MNQADEINLDMPTVPGIELLQRAPLFAKLGFEVTLQPIAKAA